MGFNVWWDARQKKICWSGRSVLYADAMGTYFEGFTRNHSVSHGAAMRMLVNRINEAYHEADHEANHEADQQVQKNRFCLQQNLDLILMAIGIVVDYLPSTGIGKEIKDARKLILNNVAPNKDVRKICTGVKKLEEFILNCPTNIWYGFSDVNSQIGDCLDLPANTIRYIELDENTMVRWNYDEPATRLNYPFVIYRPVRNSRSDFLIRNLVYGTDWKDGEIQIMGGLLDLYRDGNDVFSIMSSTDSRYLNKRLMQNTDGCYSFGIEVANRDTHASEWFLFQKTSDFTYTAKR